MNFLTRKLGPLPTWAWLGMAAGGIGLVILARRNSKSSTASGLPSAVPEPGPQGPPGRPGPPGPPGFGTSPRPIPLPVTTRIAPTQSPTAAPAPRVAPGTGGPAPESRSVGSRTAGYNPAYHPAMKAVPDYEHVVQSGSVGGTATAAGLHPVRLQAQNPENDGIVRVA